MQEHPIPQDITNYRFHIIGSMTLKQFGEVLLGVIIAVLFYNTNLTVIIKWPLIILSVGMGFAAAFVPIEERPLDHWIITFIRVLYKPTKFFWKREPKIPEPFLFEPDQSKKKEEPTLDLSPAKRERIKEYLGAIPEDNSRRVEYSAAELTRMQGILSSFQEVKVEKSVFTEKTQLKPQFKPRIDVRVRKMRKPKQSEEIIFESLGDDTMPLLMQVPKEEETQLKKPRKQTKKIILRSDQVAHDIEVPEAENIRHRAGKKGEESEVDFPIQDLSNKTFVESQAHVHDSVIAQDDASYNSDLPFPIRPTEPNKVVGMVLSQNNDLLTNAIVEIQTPEGNIARAVKSNALGQFFITTALKKGDYNVVVEKKGYQFEPKHLVIDDSIIPPMEIRSIN